MNSWHRKKLQSMPVSLSATRSLGAALTEALGQVPADFDFSDWLTQAVHSGLVLGVADATPQPQNNPDTEENP